MKRAIVFAAPLFLAGCSFGHVRQLRVGAPGPYRDVHAVKVEVGGDAPPALAATMADSARGELASAAGLVATSDAEPAFTYAMRVTTAVDPATEQDGNDALASVKSATGFSGHDAARTGALAFDGTLTAPDGTPVGFVRWEGAGRPADLADRASFQAAGALGRRVWMRRDQFFERRPADERLFLTATPETLEPGQFLVSNDELLLFRVGAGAGRRTQVDLWGGGLPIPGSGAVVGPGIVFAGAGAVVLGFADLGIKHRFLDETEDRPAISLSYDLLDVFGAGLGGAVVAGGGGAGAIGVAGGANAQFNLGTLAIGKHFGRTHLVLGGYVLDNHHFLPQSASFVAAGGTTGAGGGGAGTTKISRLPTQYQAWASVSQVLGPHSMLGLELMPRDPVKNSFGTTGARWLLGGNRPWGPFALDRIRVRLDLAGVWTYTPPKADVHNADGTTTKGHGPFIAPLPWIGLGLYW